MWMTLDAEEAYAVECVAAQQGGVGGGGPQGMSLEPAADEEDGPSNSGRIH